MEQTFRVVFTDGGADLLVAADVYLCDARFIHFRAGASTVALVSIGAVRYVLPESA